MHQCGDVASNSRVLACLRRPAIRAGSSVPAVCGETVVKRSTVFELDFDAKQTRFEQAHAVDQIGGCRRSGSRHSSCQRRLHGFGVPCRRCRLLERAETRRHQFTGLQTTGFRGCSHGHSQKADHHEVSDTIHGAGQDETISTRLFDL